MQTILKERTLPPAPCSYFIFKWMFVCIGLGSSPHRSCLPSHAPEARSSKMNGGDLSHVFLYIVRQAIVVPRRRALNSKKTVFPAAPIPLVSKSVRELGMMGKRKKNPSLRNARTPIDNLFFRLRSDFPWGNMMHFVVSRISRPREKGEGAGTCKKFRERGKPPESLLH